MAHMLHMERVDRYLGDKSNSEKSGEGEGEWDSERDSWINKLQSCMNCGTSE